MTCKVCNDKKKVWRWRGDDDEPAYDHPPRLVLVPCPKCSATNGKKLTPAIEPTTFPMPRPKKELPN